MSTLRTRWAAIGAALAVTLGAGGIGLVSATSPAKATTFVPVTPCRVMDTRPAPTTVGPKSTPIGGGETHTVTAVGTTGDCTAVPSGAAAVSLNVTAIGATLPTFLTIWATDEAQPDASSLNPVPGAPPTPNAVTTELNGDGEFNVFNLQGNVNVIADINGYYVDHHHDDRYYTETEVDDLIADNPGPAGPKGDQGDPGDKGDQGDPGPAGADGTDGTDLYTRTVVVNGDGSDSANGAALLAAIGQTSGATVGDPWTIAVEPGVFDVGGTAISLPDYVSLQGAGRAATMILGSNATVLAIGSGATVSDLAVESSTTTTAGEAIEVDGADSVTLRNLVVTVAAGSNNQTDGLRIRSSTDVLLDGVNATGLDFGANIVGVEGTIRNSEIVGTTDPALNLLAGAFPSDLVVEHSRLQALATGDEAVRFTTNSGHSLAIRHSTLISASGESVSEPVATPTNSLEMFHVHVDAVQAFNFSGTAVCAALSTPTPSVSDTTCI